MGTSSRTQPPASKLTLVLYLAATSAMGACEYTKADPGFGTPRVSVDAGLDSGVDGGMDAEASVPIDRECMKSDDDAGVCASQRGCVFCANDSTCRGEAESCYTSREACEKLNILRCGKYPESCILCAAYRGCASVGACPTCDQVTLQDCGNSAGCDPCPKLNRCVDEGACPP